MGSAALAAQGVLAAVLCVAGVGKLLDLAGSRRALMGFGVPERTAVVGGTVLPFAELAVAAGLVIHPSARWAAGVALALMLSFIGGISSAMARGQRPDCGCFGALHSAKAGWTALVRNAALAALAAFVVIRGAGPSIPDWVGERSAAELVAVGAGSAALVLAAVTARWWWTSRALRRDLAAAQKALAAVPPGLPPGALAPDFAVPEPDGATLTLAGLRAQGLPVLLVFSRPGCGPSEALLPELERWRDALAGQLTLGLVGRGSVERFGRRPDLTLQEAYEQDTELARQIDELYEVFAAYRAPATPSAVVVTPEGTIGSATVDGRMAIEALVRLTLDRPARPGRLVGLPRPAA